MPSSSCRTPDSSRSLRRRNSSGTSSPRRAPTRRPESPAYAGRRCASSPRGDVADAPRPKDDRRREPALPIIRGAGSLRSTKAVDSALLELLRDEERQLERLHVVQARVAQALVARGECCLVDLLGSAEALGDIVSRELDVDAAGE